MPVPAAALARQAAAPDLPAAAAGHLVALPLEAAAGLPAAAAGHPVALPLEAAADLPAAAAGHLAVLPLEAAAGPRLAAAEVPALPQEPVDRPGQVARRARVRRTSPSTTPASYWPICYGGRRTSIRRPQLCPRGRCATSGTCAITLRIRSPSVTLFK